MVMANNAITLRQIRAAILQDNAIFQNVNSISNSTIDRILKKHQMTMKQIYRVPFERNSDRVKELRYQYVHVSQLLVVHHYNLFTIKQWFPNFFGFSTHFTWFVYPGNPGMEVFDLSDFNISPKNCSLLYDAIIIIILILKNITYNKKRGQRAAISASHVNLSNTVGFTVTFQ